MSDQYFFGAIIGPILLILGLSLLVYHKRWIKTGSAWIKDNVNMTPLMLLSLMFGLVIVAKHNDWQLNSFIIITLVGWGAFLKGALYFLIPSKILKEMIKITNKKGALIWIGLISSILGAWLSYVVYLA